MKPTFLVSGGLQPEASQLAFIAEQEGWVTLWLARETEETSRRLSGKRFAFYGDTVAATKLATSPHFALLEPALDVLLRLPDRYVRRAIRNATLSDLESVTGSVFIKSPDPCDRIVGSGIHRGGKPTLLEGKVYDGQARILVAEPVHWLFEYRVVVLEARIIAYSLYMRDGKRIWDPRLSPPSSREEESGVLSFATSFLADPDVALPPAFVVDVGMIPGRGYAVVELNPIWCARLFGCDRRAVFPALERVCVLRSHLNPYEARWVIRHPNSLNRAVVPPS